jgi:hypothetical protein
VSIFTLQKIKYSGNNGNNIKKNKERSKLHFGYLAEICVSDYYYIKIIKEGDKLLLAQSFANSFFSNHKRKD